NGPGAAWARLVDHRLRSLGGPQTTILGGPQTAARRTGGPAAEKDTARRPTGSNQGAHPACCTAERTWVCGSAPSATSVAGGPAGRDAARRRRVVVRTAGWEGSVG